MPSSSEWGVPPRDSLPGDGTWGQSPTTGWSQPGSPPGPPAGTTAGGDSASWGSDSDSQWAVTASAWGADDGPTYYQPPRQTPLTTLYLGLAAATGGLLTAVALWLLVPRATALTVSMALVAWALCGIVSVLAVAAHQRTELRKCASVYYSPNPSARPLRMVVLVIGAIGVIGNTAYFADWLARR